MSEQEDKRNLVSRIAKGVAANGFGQLVTLLSSFVTIRLFYHFWGVSLYGEWLLLSSIPTYLTMSDLSFGTTAGSEMTMLVARGERLQALKVLQSAWLLVTFASLLVLAIMLTLTRVVDTPAVLNLSILSNKESVGVLTVLLMGVCLAQQGGLIDAVYKSAGHYAQGLFFMNMLRLIELVSMIFVLAFRGDPWLFAWTMVVPRSLCYMAMWGHLRKIVPWLHLGWSYADRKTLKPLVAPALTFNAFNLGYAVSLQGVVILIGVRASPADVALFSPLRTLTRTVVQLASMIGNTIWVELSRAVGAGDYALARKIHRRATQLSFWCVLPFQIGLLIFGPAFFQFWTGHPLSDYRVLVALVGATVLTSIWSIAYVVPMSTNKHQSTAFVFIGSAALTLVLANWWIQLYGALGACLAIIVGETVMAVFVVQKALSLLDDELKPYLVQLLTPPTEDLGRAIEWMKKLWRRIRKNGQEGRT